MGDNYSDSDDEIEKCDLDNVTRTHFQKECSEIVQCVSCGNYQANIKLHLRTNRGCCAGDNIGKSLDILGKDVGRRLTRLNPDSPPVVVKTRTSKIITQKNKEQKFELSFHHLIELRDEGKLTEAEKKSVAKLLRKLALLRKLNAKNSKS